VPLVQWQHEDAKASAPAAAHALRIALVDSHDSARGPNTPEVCMNALRTIT